MEPKTPPTQSDPATSLITLEGLINNYISKIESHQEELSKIKEMLNDALENDQDYVKAAAEAKEAAKAKSSAKSAVINQPEIARIDEKLKDGTRQLKEMREALSQHLQNYAQMSGSNQFEDENGEVREIVYVAKIVKRSNKYRT